MTYFTRKYAVILAAIAFINGTSAAFVQAQTVNLTRLSPVFYMQGNRQLTTSDDKGGWKPRIGTKNFEFGVNTFANSSITYILNNRYKRFSTWVGIDKFSLNKNAKAPVYADEDPNEGGNLKNDKAIFQVFCDGNKVFDSGPMGVSTPAKNIDIDVTGIKELELVVRDAAKGIDPNHSKNASHVNWAEPKLLINNLSENIISGKAFYSVKGGSVALQFNKNGDIVNFSDSKHSIGLKGQTRLTECKQIKLLSSKKLTKGGMQFVYLMQAPNGKNFTLTNSFIPTNTSIRWETDIYSKDKPWTTAIITSLKYPVNNETQFWTTWSHPDLVGQGGWNNAILKTQWADPLETRKFTNSARWLGSNPLSCQPTSGDIFTVPIASVFNPGNNTGLSVVQCLTDTLLYMKEVTTADGCIEFQHRFHRLGAGKHIRFNVDLVAHQADWRDGMNWMVNRYPGYFNPKVAKADEVGGCGAYSSWEGELDADKLKKMGFTFNWKASFDFPYMGMFLPPVSNWQTFATSAESAKDPWAQHPYKGAPTSRKQLQDYSQLMRGYGFHVLNYFNVTEFGTFIDNKYKPNNSLAEKDLWKSCNDYLHQKIPGGILYDQSGSDDYYRTWGAAVVMDPGAKDYGDFLVEQAQRHIEFLPSSSGICIDRMDWLRFFNIRADDGIAWYYNRPARSLYTSWHKIMASIGPLMHKNNKAIFTNPMGSMRVDLMNEVDGIYSEHNELGPGLNSSVFIGVRKPIMAWTWDEKSLQPDPDIYFQHFIYLGVFPTAPVPDNNHEIRPGEFADSWYLKYGPLLKAMHGRKWVLLPHVVSVENNTAKANLFEVPGGFAMPIVLAAKNADKAVVRLNANELGLAGKPEFEAILPGNENFVAVQVNKQADGALLLEVPLKQGCAMVRFTKK